MADVPGFRPLYQQVRDVFVQRIADGHWPPGRSIPSEIALAGELGVSQGTVRKALDTLASDHILERRQGKGTYVAEVTAERSLFQFFRMAAPGGARKTPAHVESRLKRRPSQAEEIERLGLGVGDDVFDLRRVRSIDERPVIFERIIVSAARFPGLDEKTLPNTLYALYQSDYGISVIAASEELRAKAASPKVARALGLEEGAPVLHISRIATDLDGVPVEWRRSHCDTRDLVYAVDIR